MRGKSYDAACVAVMLDARLTAPERARKLDALAREASIAMGDLCPHCGSYDVESNGSREHRCCDCDGRWEGA